MKVAPPSDDSRGALQGSLKGQEPPPSFQHSATGTPAKRSEFWQDAGGKPKLR